MKMTATPRNKEKKSEKLTKTKATPRKEGNKGNTEEGKEEKKKRKWRRMAHCKDQTEAEGPAVSRRRAIGKGNWQKEWEEEESGVPSVGCWSCASRHLKRQSQ
jgi:hypothetical protein